MNSRIRSFIAIPVPYSTELSHVIMHLQKGLKEEVLRWTIKENLHFTLCFLGDQEEAILRELADRLEDVFKSYAAGSVELGPAGTFSREGTPGVVWLGVRNDFVLRDLWEQVNSVVGALLPGSSSPKYSPHMTIARFKRLRDWKRFREILASVRNDSVAYTIPVDRIILYKSELLPTGPVYSSLKTISLA